MTCIASDLTTLFPSIDHYSLTMVGALFDQTQVLRPNLPVYKALETLQHYSNPGDDFQPRLLSIGANEGQMPLADLLPLKDIPLGLLQILPLLVSGPADQVNALAGEMEQRFLTEGQLTSATRTRLESHFKTTINHARFMTFTDLNALLKLQLEQFGFLSLWELLDAAVTPPTEALKVTTAKGIIFEWREGSVHSYFESFDWWAKHGAGTGLPASDQELQSAYADWTREYRQYLTTLSAHGINVEQHLPGMDDVGLDDSFLMEESTVAPVESAAAVTEHNAKDLGTVAVTVVKGRRQMNFYPLLASGLNDLYAFIRDQGYAGDIACPGCIVYDEVSRQLIPDTLIR